jgi:alanyl-tRNA synthetase
MRELEKMIRNLKTHETASPAISGKDAFMLFESFGFPIEMTVEIAKEQ